MTENKAVAWVQALQARGVTVRLRNNRLWLQPANAYRGLSDEELIVLRHHRQAIKDAVAFGYVAPVPAVRPTTPEPEAPLPAPACKYCGNRTCVGPSHWAYRALHSCDPTEIARRDAEATAEMNESLRRERQGIPTGLDAAFPLSDLYTRRQP